MHDMELQSIQQRLKNLEASLQQQSFRPEYQPCHFNPFSMQHPTSFGPTYMTRMPSHLPHHRPMHPYWPGSPQLVPTHQPYLHRPLQSQIPPHVWNIPPPNYQYRQQTTDTSNKQHSTHQNLQGANLQYGQESVKNIDSSTQSKLDHSTPSSHIMNQEISIKTKPYTEKTSSSLDKEVIITLNKIEQEKTLSEAQLPQIFQTESKKSLLSWSLTFLNLSALLMTRIWKMYNFKEKLLGPIPIYWITLLILNQTVFRTLPETSDDPIAHEHSALLRIATFNYDTTDMNQNTIQPGDSTANLNDVDKIPDDDDDIVLVRASLEITENTLRDIENFESYEVLDILNNDINKCKKSSNLVLKNTDMSVRSSHITSENYSMPSILNGATVKGNIIINYGNLVEEKENSQRETQKKRKWVIYGSSDSD
ncbi:unnamed protein product [Mytilus coruscus]|uniref:Uncharacterized protein n=1 Tax=Mytilus coruscus TaxID=42192 RepID=A0A6J8B542_MYTCO|nr:unnamed protein product [Mytilus coruscus]